MASIAAQPMSVAEVKVEAVGVEAAVGKKGKRGKAAAKSKQQQEDEDNANNAATVDHPYLSFLHKRIRSYKKKLEKIKGLELARSAEGKVLNAQQLELVGSKPVLEKLIAEFETLREQFIEVYLQEEEAKKAAEEEKVVALVEVVQETIAPEVEPVVEEPKVVEEPRDEFAHVEELLKTLHVVTLHQALGKDVPMVLDFFSKVLLGNTRPPAELSYRENLAESLEQAKNYLANSPDVFACDMTYSGLREIVEDLDKSAAGSADEPVEVEEEEAPVEQPAELPHINFFTDSQLEPEEIGATDVAQPAEAGEVEEPVEDVPVDVEEVAVEVAAESVTVESVPEIVEPPPSALPIPPPPKSFADVASGGRTSPSGSNRSASPTAGESNEKAGNQRRRPQGNRWKKDNVNGAKATTSGGANPNKPRRPRPQRSSDENAGPQSANRTGDRRPRGDSRKKQVSPHVVESTPIAPHA